MAQQRSLQAALGRRAIHSYRATLVVTSIFVVVSRLDCAIGLTTRTTTAAAVAFVRSSFIQSPSGLLKSLSASSPTTDLASGDAAPTDDLPQHLVLIGGGHAHIQVVKALHAAARPRHVSVTLIDTVAAASYSGMVPGCIAGLYNASETLLHLAPLAQWANCTFIQDTVVDVDLERKYIYLQNRMEPMAFDVVSMDIGSTSRGYQSTPGALQYAIPTRPIYALVDRLDKARRRVLSDSAVNSGSGKLNGVPASRSPNNRRMPPKIVVIGGGVAGMELAMVVTSRWIRDGIRDVECTILDAGPCPQQNPSLDVTTTTTKPLLGTPESLMLSLLQSKRIAVRYDSRVVKIDEHAIHLAGTGETVSYTHCLWATGAGAHRLSHHLHHARGLDCDDNGWIKVHDTLQSTSHDFLFAAGDCAAVQLSADCNIPKAGVYAVRAGPVLIENLTRYLESIHSPSTALSSSTSSSSITRQLPVVLHPYIPQVDFLKLLVCGDGTALGFRFGLVLRGKWVFDLKDNIDRSFMNLFDVSALPNPPPSVEDGHQLQQSGYDTRQYDSSESETTLDDVQRLLSRPDEAAILLQRIDDGVDFRQAKAVLRAMGSDVVFRQAVLQHVRDTKTEMAVLQT